MSGSAVAIPLVSFNSRFAAPRQAVTDQPDVTADPYQHLVEAATAGEKAAIESLLVQLRPLIVRYCRSRIGRSVSTFASADDVAQEVCMAVLTALPSFRSNGGSFLGFVYGIATHKIMDFHRKYSRDKSVPVAELPEVSLVSGGPEHQILRTELGEQLGRLLAELSPTQREVLTLRLVMGLSVSETAEMISVSPGAVRVCQHRALAKLRRRVMSSKTSTPG